MKTSSFITIDFGNLQQVDSVLSKFKEKSGHLQAIKLSEIIDVLDSVGKLWRIDSPLYKEACEKLPTELNFDIQTIKASLEIIPDLLRGDNLLKRVTAEFGRAEVLDKFITSRDEKYELRARPLGILLHITAGNIFLGMLDSIVMGLLTKNLNLVKLSTRNLIFPRLFWKSLMLADINHTLTPLLQFLIWKGGDEKIESKLKKNVNGIIVWGGEEAQKSYAKNLPPNVKLFHYGPKISFQVLTKKALENCSDEEFNRLGSLIAEDICPWDQSACAAAQNLFIPQDIKSATKNKLIAAIEFGFKNFPIPRGHWGPEDQVETLKQIARAQFDCALGKGSLIQGRDWFVQIDCSPYLSPSPLGRSLLIKPYDNLATLKCHLEPFAYYLQTCGYYATFGEQENLLEQLAQIGVKRITPVGKMLTGSLGVPHDGRWGLQELTSYTTHEHVSEQLNKLITHAKTQIEYYQNNSTIDYLNPTLKQFPLISGKNLQAAPISVHNTHIDQTIYQKGGVIFASGGTSGKPKYSFYSHKEFEYAAQLLAIGFKACGLTTGTKVANLFVAGNFWSSFRAVGSALCQIGAIELPIGGLGNQKDILNYLIEFKPQVVMGLPSLLMQYANLTLQENYKIEVPTVFFAGENLTDAAKKLLKDAWKTQHYYSAGYASVDVGPIGYADTQCGPGEHYLLPNISMEVINEEAVITSLYRLAMPIIRYKTGDRVKVLEENSLGPIKFKLLGRLDGQIQIWSCKFYFSDIEKVLKNIFAKDIEFQIEFQVELSTQKNTMAQAQEHLHIRVRKPDLSADENYDRVLAHSLYLQCPDLAQSYDLSFFENKVSLEFIDQLPLVPRTGKLSSFIDLR